MDRPSRILLVVDGHSIAYRAYFAFIKRPLINSKGFNTSAVFGFINSLIKAIRDTRATHVAIAFDRGLSRRDETVREYKVTRPEMPDELSLSIGYIKRIVRAMGYRIVEVEGYEADDVIYTLVRRFQDSFDRIYILTSDKDILQIVSDKVLVYDSRADVVYDPEKVEEKFGIPPHLIPDYLTLVGDQIDNIPGIKGVGPKTAVELIRKYGPVERIVENADELPAKLRRAIKEKAQELIEIKEKVIRLMEVPLEIGEEELRPSEMDRVTLFSLLNELELFRIMEEFAQDIPALPVDESDTLPEPPFPLHIDEEHIYFHDGEGVKRKRKELLDLGHPGLVFDSKELFKAGYSGSIFDLLLADYLIDPDLASKKSTADPLEYMLLKYMGYRKPQNIPSHQESAWKVNLVHHLHRSLRERLEEDDLLKLLREIEIPVAHVLGDMERRGIRIDTDYLKELGSEVETHLMRIEAEIYSLAGERFNINSPKQLARILYQKLKLPPLKRTRTGYSTDSEVLMELAKQHPLPAKILEFRELYKLKSTYIDNLLEMVDARTGRIYPTFNQRGTSTGRISAQKPNIQNIPVISEIGRRIRKAFVAEEGHLLIKADYSQIELRILAHLSGDGNLVEAFRRGEDIHTRTARIILGKEEITPEERRLAKAVNFGIIYGISPYGLSRQVGIEIDEAARFIEQYFENHPGVKQWIERTLKLAEEKGYVRTIMGRLRRIPRMGLLSPNKNVRDAWRRITINAPVQGSAADIVKVAMIRTNPMAPIIMQIHDELVFEVEEGRAEELAGKIREIMESVVQLKVPLKVDVSISERWG